MARGISDVLSIYLDPKAPDEAPTRTRETEDKAPPQSGRGASARSEPKANEVHQERPPQSKPPSPIPRILLVPLDPQDLLEPVLTWNLAAALHHQSHPLQLTPYWVDPCAPPPVGDAILLWLHASAPGLERAQRRLEGADPRSTIDTIVYGGADSTSAPTWHHRLRVDRREAGALSPHAEMRCQGAICGGVEIARSLVRGRPILDLDGDGAIAHSLLAIAERLASPTPLASEDA